MTKELYLDYRTQYKTQHVIHPDILREYYEDHNKNTTLALEGEEFEYYFSHWLQTLGFTNIVNKIFEKVMAYFDIKYEITVLMDKDHNELKAY